MGLDGGRPFLPAFWLGGQKVEVYQAELRWRGTTQKGEKLGSRQPPSLGKTRVFVRPQSPLSRGCLQFIIERGCAFWAGQWRLLFSKVGKGHRMVVFWWSFCAYRRSVCSHFCFASSVRPHDVTGCTLEEGWRVELGNWL